MIRIITTLLVICTLTASAGAKDVSIGPVVLSLTPPPDHCELEAGEPADAPLIEAVEKALGDSGNRLLAMSADCNELHQMRAGERRLLDSFAQFQTLVGLEAAPPLSAPQGVIGHACRLTRERNGEIAGEADASERLAAAENAIQPGETRYLGVLAQEPLACYGALLQRFKTQIGSDRMQVGVYATAAIRGKIIYHYLYAATISGGKLTTLLEQQKAAIRRLRAANPD